MNTCQTFFCFDVGFSEAMAQTIWWMHRPSRVCWNIFAFPASTTYTNLTEWCCSWLFTVAGCFCLLVLFLSPRFFLAAAATISTSIIFSALDSVSARGCKRRTYVVSPSICSLILSLCRLPICPLGFFVFPFVASPYLAFPRLAFHAGVFWSPLSIGTVAF